MTKGQVALGVIIPIGVLLAGWLFFGVNKAQDTAAAALQQTAIIANQVSSLQAQVTATKDNTDKILQVLIQKGLTIK